MTARIGVIAVAVALAAAPVSAARADPVLAAAGDIACPPGSTPTATTCQQASTAGLISSASPDAVALLGDNQYESGSYAQYTGAGGFGSSWGAFKGLLRPAPGNHEYGTANASGYFDYFGAAAGTRGQGWYSYDLGGWHVVVLNSSDDCAPVGCAKGSAQEQWLKSDLAAHASQCTLAYWHHPRWTSGFHGNDTAVAPFWDDLYAAGADVVLNGHDHDYERFAPQSPDETLDTARGIREFVVGTGGYTEFEFGSSFAPNSERHDDQTHGVLQLTLRPGGYAWTFLPVAGKTFTDSGSASCH
jgi:acid phosphatase type 7